MSGHRYDRMAQGLHWLTAALILTLLLLGLWMVRQPPMAARTFALFQLHKSLGILVLLLTLVRLGWRLTHPGPPPPSCPAWMRRMAAAGHGLLYLLMLGLPLTGWVLVSVSPLNLPTRLFGTLAWPHLPLAPVDRAAAAALASMAHAAAAWIMITLLAGHVGAALYHHFRLRDGTLSRMLPETKI